MQSSFACVSTRICVTLSVFPRLTGITLAVELTRPISLTQSTYGHQIPRPVSRFGLAVMLSKKQNKTKNNTHNNYNKNRNKLISKRHRRNIYIYTHTCIYTANNMRKKWKDRRNKTSFKLIFCMLSTELVYNQDKKCTSPSKENISMHLKHNCTHTLGRAHTHT